MKKFIVMVLFCLCFSELISASAEEEKDSKISLVSSIGVFDKYLYQWNGSVYDKRSSLQSDSCLTFPSGFYADIWLARQYGEVKDGRDGDETDYAVGWSGKLWGLSFDSALVYYDLALKPEGSKNDYWAPYVKLSKSYGEKTVISPFIRAEFIIPAQKGSSDGGILLSPGVETEIPILRDTFMSGATYFSYDSGSYGEDKNIIFGHTLSLKTVSGRWTLLFPNCILTVPLQEDSRRKTEVCYGFSLKKILW